MKRLSRIEKGLRNMSEQKRVTEYMRGRIHWAKIFGAPRPNYDGDAREWTFEFEPDDNGVETLRKHGLSDRLRERRDKKGYEERGPFLILKRKEFKVDGTPNEHIRVVDARNQTWGDNRLIGNDSLADVKVTIVDYGPRKKKGIYPVAIRVLELVPYQRQEFEPLDDDDEYVRAVEKQEDTFRQDFGLEDEEEDVPFETEEEEPEPEKPRRGRKAKLAEGELDDDVPL